MKNIWSFVVTGGPCSGKTTALSIIEQELVNRGFCVLIIPETATELISNGIKSFDGTLSSKDFELLVIQKQLNKEKLYQMAAQMHSSQKIVILHDRGIIDGKSYVTQQEFTDILNELNITEMEARNRYDAVFHLVTAANGAEEYYTLENNLARTESAEQARMLDIKGISNWAGHPNLKIIDNSTDFKGKMRRLMNEVYSVLGIPEFEVIDRKILVKKPDLEKLSTVIDYTVIDIVQTYVKSLGNIERRLRQYGQNGNFMYYLTEKYGNLGDVKRKEVQKRISEKEYLLYLLQMDTQLKPIVKKRLCFTYNNQYFRLDIFDFSKELAILEIDIEKGCYIDYPEFIEVVEDVTGNPAYRNYNLSRTQTLMN